MASSSTYDVFLSFRGEDSRSNFTSHLHHALERGSLRAFVDVNHRREEFIDIELLHAIQRSRVSVIVMSGNYASSRWCLDELVCIMELWRREDRLVLPIFYNVDPSDVRKQKRRFGEALEKHRCRQIEQTTMLKWREALTQLANISGWVTKNHRADKDLVLDIVKSIQSKGLPTRLNISIYPLRYDTCDEYLKVFLQTGSQEVVIVGICGPGQMGKTAMARVMYDRILHNFDGGCFLADVGQRSDQPNYLVRLQETLLSKILSERSVKISDTRMGRDPIAQNLCSKRVLIVLDNVDDLRQIYALVGDRKFFGPGSKIIITTRHVQLLELFGVDQFILAQGRPLPENVAVIWEPYQRSRCVVAGLKEYIETFNQQRLDKLRYLQAVLLQKHQRNATQERLISELLEAHGEGSSSTAYTITETVMDGNGSNGVSINQKMRIDHEHELTKRLGVLHLTQTMKHETGAAVSSGTDMGSYADTLLPVEVLPFPQPTSLEASQSFSFSQPDWPPVSDLSDATITAVADMGNDNTVDTPMDSYGSPVETPSGDVEG